jgi:acylphosphatase
MARIARHVRVTGRVQGVFFRAWTREQAQALQVSGWVRNCSDGSVEAHLEGNQEAVTKLIRRMREGPRAAQVSAVETSDVDREGLDDFTVSR